MTGNRLLRGVEERGGKGKNRRTGERYLWAKPVDYYEGSSVISLLLLSHGALLVVGTVVWLFLSVCVGLTAYINAWVPVKA